MIDAHVHPINLIKSTGDSDYENYEKILKDLLDSLNRKKIYKALVYLLDEEINASFNKKKFGFENIILGVLINPRATNIERRLDELLENNIKIVKVLPYEQEIFRNDYKKVLNLARHIEKRNMILTVCCSYGSKYIYDTNGIELVSYLLRKGIKSPVIMAHGGMAKVLDAMSLMLEYENIYMDISFTLPFWWGSSVIEDYAFALKKLDYERVFYGSDFPYVSIEESKKYFDMFCDKYNLEYGDTKKILELNFKDFLETNNLI